MQNRWSKFAPERKNCNLFFQMADDKVRASQGNDPMTNHDSKFLGRNKMKRKVLSVLLASAMVASLAACGSKEETTDNAAGGSTAAATETADAADTTSAEILTDKEVIEKASLKETSLYDLALKFKLEDPKDFVCKFIDFDRGARN